MTGSLTGRVPEGGTLGRARSHQIMRLLGLRSPMVSSVQNSKRLSHVSCSIEFSELFETDYHVV